MPYQPYDTAWLRQQRAAGQIFERYRVIELMDAYEEALQEIAAKDAIGRDSAPAERCRDDELRLGNMSQRLMECEWRMAWAILILSVAVLSLFVVVCFR